VSLVLKSAELLLCNIAAWRLHQAPEDLSVVESPVSLRDVRMFKPL